LLGPFVGYAPAI